MTDQDREPIEPPPSSADETFTSGDATVASFLAQWGAGRDPQLVDFLPPIGHPQRLALLQSLIVAELQPLADAGRSPRLEHYLEQFPELGGRDQVTVELIAAEYSARCSAGEQVNVQEYESRFPRQFDAWKRQLPNQSDRSIESTTLRELKPGSVIGDFSIVRLLGAGGFARVYLAVQRSLDRQVALKVSRDEGTEGETLARLDHSHIVPVFSQQVVDGNRLLAMRYVPGQTLADWMMERPTVAIRSWRGQDLLDWLSDAAAPPNPAVGHPTAAAFASQRWVPAMCRLVLDVATALSHAHQHGVVHHDVKPANILLDRDGRALLMDFNVASRIDPACGSQVIGGTASYMAPEHIRAMDRGLPGETEVIDARSDVYSLGVVFYELLTGHHPWSLSTESSKGTANLREMLASRLQHVPTLPTDLPGVTPGLQAMLAKCLAPSPADRYAAARELVDDLERLLDNRTLAFAEDPSGAERTAKWFRRHPRTSTAIATVAVAGLALLLTLLTADVKRVSTAEDWLEQAERSFEMGDGRRAAVAIGQAQKLLAAEHAILPTRWTRAPKQQAEQRIRTLGRKVADAEHLRFEASAAKHRVVELSGSEESLGAWDTDPLDIYQVLERNGWERTSQFTSLPPERRLRVRQDITELLLSRMLAVGASAHPNDNQSPASSAAKLKAMRLDLLDRIPAIYQGNPVVRRLREGATHESIPTVEELARFAESEFDHYLVGVIAAQQGQFSAAIERFDASLQGLPSRFWARFLHAYCCQQMGRLEQAIAGYGICIGMRNDFAWSHHNLALLYTKQGRYEAAEKELRLAIELAPESGAGYANLGVVLFQRGRFRDALRSLDRAFDLRYETVDALVNRAAVRAALGNLAGARQDLEQALSIDPESNAARQRLEQLP